MDTWMSLLRGQVAARSMTAVAEELGVSRTAISLVMSGKYPGKTDRMAARIIAAYARVRCPYVQELIPLADCRARQKKMPTSSPGALRWWRVCQNCEHKESNHDQSGN